MNDPDTPVDPVVFLNAALGGRPIYGFLWILWLCIAFDVSTGADLLRKEAHSRSTICAFTVGILGVFIIGFRLILFLKSKDQRRQLFSIDPRCSTQKVSGFSRVAIMTVPLLGLLEIAAVWFWR